MELQHAIADARPALQGDPEGERVLRFAAGALVSLVQPYAPHIAEELWGHLGGERLWEQPWPQADERFLVRDTFTLVVQVNGKVRGRVQLARGLDRDGMLAAARALPNVRAHSGWQDGREGDRRARPAREHRCKISLCAWAFIAFWSIRV